MIVGINDKDNYVDNDFNNANNDNKADDDIPSPL